MREPAFRVTWFLIFTAVTTGAVSHLNAHGSFGKAGSLAMMWCPAVAALGASVVTRRSLKEIGWRPQPKWIAIGWLLPISYAFVAYRGVWLAGLGSVPNPTFLSRAQLTLNMAHRPDWLVIVAAFGFITVCLLLLSMVSTLAEELGWRGFLVPELTQWIGTERAALTSGVIWCAWHFPALLWFGYGVTGTPKIYQIACFSLMVVASAVVMAWLRIRSGSIWPAVVMHAVHTYGGPDVLRPHYGTHSSHSLFHRGIWNRTGHSSGCLSHLLHPEVANLRAR